MKTTKIQIVDSEDLREKQGSLLARSIYKVMTLAHVLVLSSVLFSPGSAASDNEMLVDVMNRMSTMEDENRNLYGKIEELQHELKIVTQKMEALSADVEYRLGEAKGGADANAPAAASSVPAGPLAEDAKPGDKMANDLTPHIPEATAPAAVPSAAPAAPAAVPAAVPETKKESYTDADLFGATSAPNDKYVKARAFLEQGDYIAAEHAFSSFLKAHPKDDNAGAAQYWLGVTFFVRGDHEKAAGEFARGYKNYPKSKKAPDTLLKLAKSLHSLNRKNDACSALDQLGSQFPKAYVKEVASQRKKWKCPA